MAETTVTRHVLIMAKAVPSELQMLDSALRDHQLAS